MGETRRLLKYAGKIDPVSAAAYAEVGGYQALKKAVAEPEMICEIMKASGLRGRGGAGFPVGVKWDTTRVLDAEEKYIICNADEGEPGTNKDRVLLSEVPHSVLEGMAIAGAAVGAGKGYLYVRAEYPYVRDILLAAVKDAQANGYLGKNLFGSGIDFSIEIRTGQGAYICGEETALMESIEGRRGEPRKKPPFPGVSGLWGKPTVINNVESMANVPLIVLEGPEEFRKFGTEKCPGTKLYTLSGHVNRPGVYEYPMGVTIRQLLEEAGGGLAGTSLKAIQTGGESGPVVGPEFLDTPMDIESCAAAGASLGTGDLLFLNETVPLPELARNIMSFFAEESCGKCVPCRLGTRRMCALLDQLYDSGNKENILEDLESLAEYMRMSTFCALGQAAPVPLLSLLKNFRTEFFDFGTGSACRSGGRRG